MEGGKGGAGGGFFLSGREKQEVCTFFSSLPFAAILGLSFVASGHFVRRRLVFLPRPISLLYRGRKGERKKFVWCLIKAAAAAREKRAREACNELHGQVENVRYIPYLIYFS